MVEEVVSIDLPVHEKWTVHRNRLAPEGFSGREKRISIVTGIHGDELNGQYICFEVTRRINENPQKLHGIVDIYPDLNPLGIDTGTRGIPMFQLDMNRSFPGDNNGAVAEYVSAGIIDSIIGSDFCLDIHSSNIFIKEMPQARLTEDNREKLMPYVQLINTDFVWIYASKTVLDATLACSLNTLGVPTLAVEMGVGNRINKDYCHQLIDGIFNIMAELGIWDGEQTQSRMPILSSEGQVEFIRAQASGVFVPDVRELGAIAKGTHIGDMINPLTGQVLQTIESPFDGIIFTLREHPVVYKGALLVRVYSGDVR
jgi:predicted deacylase